ncbi:MAG TPA: MmgE/PrpD family protein [Bradyrhizobium sp.]|uniref:MmgE/PrpD family protein n=1 Tax=Bradyrhizobium sp. TaxID=376 RepID=UPI002B7A43D6|nr:MmgE/PrpD family protein [Bradyrhizobium sp.]HLZ02891.1 MmgE/PrpD family protein [Bradyrhizobium sp.]
MTSTPAIPLPPCTTRPAEVLAGFATELRLADVPAAVRERARLLILDGIGLAFAAHAYDFAPVALGGVAKLAGSGDGSVIGSSLKLPVRDSALANGILIHGLDFDDTHIEAIVHPTAATLPCALALSEQRDLSGSDLLTAYIAGMETAVRLGMAIKGGFHHVGFHATGVISHFSSAIVAAKLLGLTESQTVAAQGIAASTASGVQVFLEEGAWTKRFHPGWGAVAGITAAQLASSGFHGPSRPYEGRFGLLHAYLQQHASDTALDSIGIELGQRWHFADTAVKPYPVCHFIHGALEAAILLRDEIGNARIASVDAYVPEKTLPIIAEPAASKKRPTTDYEAKFSTHYCVATGLLKGRFGLSELEAGALAAQDVLALAGKVACHADPETKFPEAFSGGVRVRLADGREFRKHIAVNEGSGHRALSRETVIRKFVANATMTIPEAAAKRACGIILAIEESSARAVAEALRSVASERSIRAQAVR